MLPLVFQSFQINLLVALIFYGLFFLVAHKLNVQGLSLIQVCYAVIRVAILAPLAAWVYGFLGLWWALIFLLPLIVLSIGRAYFQTKVKVDLHGAFYIIPIVFVFMLAGSALSGGYQLHDWTVFQQDCPTVTANELPKRTERAFVVSNAEIKRKMRGHHVWESTDSDGNTTYHHAYYAPLVDEAWTVSEPVPAWVDLDDKDVEWVGRVIRDESSQEQWMAVSDSKNKYQIFGIGRQNGEETYRVVESDKQIIENVAEERNFNAVALLLMMIASSISLFWLRHDGAVSKVKAK